MWKAICSDRSPQKTSEDPHSRKCDECGEQFALKSHFKLHEMFHKRENPYVYKCNECGKQFPTVGNLKKYERIHHGEKPHKCNETERKAICHSGNSQNELRGSTTTKSLMDATNNDEF